MQQVTEWADFRWPNAIWAWEFLRRNPNYKQDFERYLGKGPVQKRLPSGSRLLIGDDRYEAAREWGLLYFADPNLTAYEAGVFWKPSTLAATIPVSLRDPMREKDRERYGSSKADDMVILSKLSCERLLFESINNSRHVLLAPRRLWIQLYCDSAHPLGDTALVNFRIEGARRVNERITSLQHLIQLHRSAGRKLSTIGHRRNTDRLAQALIALDVKAAGGSYKDIGQEIFPKLFTQSNYQKHKSALKQKAVRAYDRGRIYRDGKYLELLS